LFGLSETGGGSPDSIEDDVAELIRAVRLGEAMAPFFVASKYGALFLAQQRDAGGNRLFPNINLRSGGDILGIPLILGCSPI
jgi:hypothetical protein